jgi:hypothetical protein
LALSTRKQPNVDWWLVGPETVFTDKLLQGNEATFATRVFFLIYIQEHVSTSACITSPYVSVYNIYTIWCLLLVVSREMRIILMK